MLSETTTFVVGAGASNPFGLSTGFELKLKTVKYLKRDQDLHRYVQRALRIKNPTKFSDFDLERFRASLEKHPGHSIDEFLEDRRAEDDVVAAGKAIIAALIGQEMKSHHLASPQEDWLRFLVNRMREGADSPNVLVAGNNVRFVTFNFDTFIESKLPSLVSATYGRVPTSAAFPEVTHVHGKLEFDGDIMVGTHYGNQISPIWLQWVAASIDRINVTSDDIDPNVLAEAQQAISNASVVCFLGFSYNEVNVIRRLGLPKTLKAGARVFGSAKGLTGSDMARVRRRFVETKIDLVDATCRQLFDDERCVI